MQRLSRALLTDKPPFAVTVYLAALGWLLVFALDTADRQKLVEYRIDEIADYSEDGKDYGYEVRLTNLSNSRFNDMEFVIEAPNIVDAADRSHAVPLPPAFQSEAAEPGGEQATYRIGILHPGQVFVLRARYQGIDDTPVFRLKSLAEPQEIYLVENSAWTWSIRNRGRIIVAIASFWALAILATLGVATAGPLLRDGDEREG